MDIHPEVLEKIFNQEEVPVIVLKEFEIDTYVNGHHVYKDIWTPEIGENLDVQIEPNNPADNTLLGHENLEKLWGIYRKKQLVDLQKQYSFS